MKQLTLHLRGAGRINPTIMIDGQQAKAKKNKFGSLDVNYTTEKDKVEVAIYRHLQLASPLWWLIEIFFYIFSLFGLLDTSRQKDNIVLDCKFLVDLTGQDNGEVNVAIRLAKQDSEAIKIDSALPTETLSNVYYVDPKIKKRQTILKWIKLLIFIAVIVTLVLLIKQYTK